MNGDGRTVVVIDTETTGLDASIDRPWEVAWQVLRLTHGAVTRLRDIETVTLPLSWASVLSLHYSAKELPDMFARAVQHVRDTGTNRDELVEGASVDVLARIVSQCPEGHPPIWAGINPTFDIAMLRAGTLNGTGFHYTPWDVANTVRAKLGYLPWETKTDTLFTECGVTVEDRHTAAGDVAATVALIEWLVT